MRTIERAGRFRRDYKRELKGRHGSDVSELVAAAVEELAADRSLPTQLRDHALTGIWVGCRDCHIRPDLVLIYAKPDDRTLQLLRLGSHSELDLG